MDVRVDSHDLTFYHQISSHWQIKSIPLLRNMAPKGSSNQSKEPVVKLGNDDWMVVPAFNDDKEALDYIEAWVGSLLKIVDQRQMSAKLGVGLSRVLDEIAAWQS